MKKMLTWYEMEEVIKKKKERKETSIKGNEKKRR